MRGALGGFEGFAVFLVGAFAGESVLCVREHHGDRRAEFVRGIGGEAGLLCECGVEAGERAGQLGEHGLLERAAHDREAKLLESGIVKDVRGSESNCEHVSREM